MCYPKRGEITSFGKKIPTLAAGVWNSGVWSPKGNFSELWEVQSPTFFILEILYIPDVLLSSSDQAHVPLAILFYFHFTFLPGEGLKTRLHLAKDDENNKPPVFRYLSTVGITFLISHHHPFSDSMSANMLGRNTAHTLRTSWLIQGFLISPTEADIHIRGPQGTGSQRTCKK